MTLRTLLVATASLALAACADADPAPEPKADVEEAPSANTGEQASIIRPDIEIARTLELEPLTLTLGFGDSGTELTGEGVNALSELLESPQIAQFDGAITLRGHSDAGGNDALNLRMSQERADAVAQWLVDNGVAESRITTVAFGEQNPLEPNALPDGTPNEAGRAANRRVDIHVAVPEGATIPAPAEPEAPTTEPGATGSLLRDPVGS